MVWFVSILAAAALLFVTFGAEPIMMILGCVICVLVGLHVGIIIGKT